MSSPIRMLVFSAPTLLLTPGGTARLSVAVVGPDPSPNAVVTVALTGGLVHAVDGLQTHTYVADALGVVEFELAGTSDGIVTAVLRDEPDVRATLAVTVGVRQRSIVVGDERSQLVLRVQPPAAAAATIENRHLSHSDYQPTGRYVRAGEIIGVAAENRGAVQIAVGLYGVNEGHNGGADVGVAIVDGSNTGGEVRAPRDGMVFAVNSSDAPLPVEITGGVPVPTFVEHETDDAEFLRQLSERSDAPFITVVSDRMFGDFQRATVSPYASRLASVAANWDVVVAATDRVYGLRTDVTGVAWKSPNRIYVANPDSGLPGVYASANNARLLFPVSSGAGQQIFSRSPDQLWGFWHEIGHTYQTPQYLWTGLLEVTVNISSLAVQEAGGWSSRLDIADVRTKLAAFRTTPLGGRDYDTIADLFLKVLMFDQLRRAFGEDFYPRLNQEYRVRAAIGERVADMKQTFMRLASAVSGRNLERFFLEWGLAPDQETIAALRTHPALEEPVWDYNDRATERRIDSVQPYVIPTGPATIAASSHTLGRSVLPAIDLVAVGNSDGRGSVALDSVAVDYRFAPDGADLHVVVVNDLGVRNAQTIPLDLRMGTSLQLQGYANKTYAWLALDVATGSLRSGSISGTVNVLFPDRQYFAVTIEQPDGTTTRSAADGNMGAGEFATRLNGTPYRIGTRITVEHLEPNRAVFWVHDEKQPASKATTQVFVVTGDDTLERTS